jgi:multidrug efflux pump subunit AcrA (membrane-fusion protein)
MRGYNIQAISKKQVDETDLALKARDITAQAAAKQGLGLIHANNAER